MSPLGYLLLNNCDNNGRIDISSLRLKLEAIGISITDALRICKVLELTPVQWVN